MQKINILDIEEVYKKLTEILVSYDEQIFDNGCKKIILKEGNKKLTFNFIPKETKLISADSVVVNYVEGEDNYSALINSVDEALAIVSDYYPDLVKSPEEELKR